MTLSIGIVGLPNVGKSTLFNALTQAQNAEAANYPFCTIEPNKAIVTVPDERVDHLAQILDVPNAIHATVEFVDVAGLVKGASQGEGLGNQFLGHIRDVSAIVHVVRCFDDPNVVHVSAQPRPADDIEIINTELALADLAQLERKLDKLTRDVKGDRALQPVLELANKLVDYLGEGHPIWTYHDQTSDAFKKLNHELKFLTAKPVIYVANVGEDEITSDTPRYQEAVAIAEKQGAGIVKISAQLEAEIASLPPDERAEFLEMAGLESSGLEKLIRAGYRLLGLTSYFSYNDSEVRAWTIKQGWTAPQAAGVIHTDFERGFIRAEVIPYSVFVKYGDRSEARSAGAVRIEGQDYRVQDGDVIQFRFNV